MELVAVKSERSPSMIREENRSLLLENDRLRKMLQEQDKQPSGTSTSKSTPTAKTTTHTATKTIKSSPRKETLAVARNSQDTGAKSEDLKKVALIVSQEDRPTEHAHITLFKESEDGKLSLFDMTGFNLGASLDLSPDFKRGFSREVISKVLGGGHMASFHFLNGTAPLGSIIRSKTPYMAFNAEWNPDLPSRPGEHGLFLTTKKRKIRGDIHSFSRLRAGEWCYTGIYNVKRRGEFDLAQIRRLSEATMQGWINDMAASPWGKKRVKKVNKTLRADQQITVGDPESIFEAMLDGRFELQFTIMQCVGYTTELFEKLEEEERSQGGPQAAATKEKKKAAPRAQRRDPASEEDKDGDEEEEEEEEEVEVPIASKRKSRRAIPTRPVKRRKRASHTADEDSQDDDGAFQLGDSDAEYRIPRPAPSVMKPRPTTTAKKITSPPHRQSTGSQAQRTSPRVQRINSESQRMAPQPQRVVPQAKSPAPQAQDTRDSASSDDSLDQDDGRESNASDASNLTDLSDLSDDDVVILPDAPQAKKSATTPALSSRAKFSSISAHSSPSKRSVSEKLRSQAFSSFPSSSGDASDSSRRSRRIAVHPPTDYVRMSKGLE